MPTKDIHDKKDNEKAVNLTWTWFLFLIANVLVMIGIAISWGIYGNGASNSVAYTPIIVCNVIAMFLMAAFYFFDSRNIFLIRQHITPRSFRLYFAAGFVFVLNLIIVYVYLALIDKITAPLDASLRINVGFGIIFGIAALISLITIGIYRYARYKIDLTLYLRRHGQATKDKEEKPEIVVDQPTSGVTSNADKQ